MMCLVLEPIDPSGISLLEDAGIEVCRADLSNFASALPLLRRAHAVITRGRGIDAASLRAAENLILVSHHGTGLDAVDVAASDRNGILVTNTPEANAAAVAEHAVMLMLAVARKAVAADGAARRGDFGFKYDADVVELGGRVLGLVGVGSIGVRVARIARAGFGMRVIACRSPGPTSAPDEGIALCPSLDALLARSDVVSLHLPHNAVTHGLIGARQLALMKPGAILVNTARGGLVDESALAEALAAGRLAGAGLDVFADETESLRDSPLAHLPNVVLSPHLAGSSRDALAKAAGMAAAQVIDVFADRRPPHLVNPHIWDRRRHPSRAPEGTA